ncbi:MAG: molecular chaperone DnaK [Chlamydiales bacterium]|jgi:molecular chaperone DnaK
MNQNIEEPILGIDLGTTNSSVAIISKGKPKIISVDGSYLVPSVVSVDAEGKTLVGKPALNNQVAAPEQTISCIKRKMGRDEIIQLHGKDYTPPMISSLILSRLKLAAEDFCGCSLQKAVITVPAYFNEEQRKATVEAGTLAGLEVLRLLNEPTSAALSYALNRQDQGLYLVYDLGGGTFDVSIVDLSQGVMEVRASHGDTHLGGMDIDGIIYEKALESFKEKHGVDFSDDPVAVLRCMQAAEAAKIRLSTEISAEIKEEYIYKKEGVGLHLEYSISRPEFEDLLRPTLEKSLVSVRKAMEEASCVEEDLKRVILVGGSTYIPLVATMLEKELGVSAHAWINPSTVVVQGAAIEASNLDGKPLGALMVDVTPHSLGTETLDINNELINHILIRRNTPLPATASQIFYKAVRDTNKIRVTAYQGESMVSSKNEFLGEFTLDKIQGTNTDEILIKFELDRSGLLKVTATDLGTSKKASSLMKRESKSRVKSCNLADLESVSIQTDTFDAEVDICNAEVEEHAFEESFGEDKSKIEVLHFIDEKLETQVTNLLDGDTLDEEDKKELKDVYAQVKDGNPSAVERLEDLLYYLA